MRTFLTIVLLGFTTIGFGQIKKPTTKVTPKPNSATPIQKVIIEKKNGDKITGLFVSGDTNSITIKISNTKVPINLNEIKAIRFETETRISVIEKPSKPQIQYIGMIIRSRYNNDTAYLMEQGKQTPTSAGLNDIIGGRFKVISISVEEVVLEDMIWNLKYQLKVDRTIKIPNYSPLQKQVDSKDDEDEDGDN
jgi:hypothetical protein